MWGPTACLEDCNFADNTLLANTQDWYPEDISCGFDRMESETLDLP
jgi:hypothetical protein